MTAIAALPLLDARSRPAGTLTLEEQSGRDGRLHDLTADAGRPAGAPAIELEQQSQFRWRLDVAGEVAAIEPAELFEPDTSTPLRGRLRTREVVGEIDVQVQLASAGEPRLCARLHVRPLKVDEAAYRAMLSDLAAISVELLHRGFAPSAGRYRTTAGSPPRLLYQQFALLHLQLFGRQLDWALARILSQPYSAWETVVEEVPAGGPMKGSSRLSRALAAPGPRASVHGDPLFATVPRRMRVDRTQSTLDNLPNRYVRFVLERWRTIAVQAQLAVEQLGDAPRRRGRTEVRRTVERLNALLAEPLFREVGTLRAFPQGNQVLIKRDGYRQVAAAAAVVEASLGLDLDGLDPFLVSQQAVALMYEYWCFVQVAEAVGRICGQSCAGELFEVVNGGMALRLKDGSSSRVSFATRARGRALDVELLFNHRFARGSDTWSTAMQPDCSLRLRPAAAGGRSAGDWWLHFDAKYRLRRGSGDRLVDVDGPVVAEALTKMHAYRDGIRDSAGAFVLFPGGREEWHAPAEELLPAIGALPLRPGHAQDRERLERTIRAAFDHVADRSSRLDRARHWRDAAYTAPAAPPGAAMETLLDRPPADTPVLLGYVNSRRQRRWIERRRRYNVRNDQRRGALRRDAAELDARLLLLYGGYDWSGPPVLHRRISSWMPVSGATMRADGYPGRRGDAYLCCDIEPVPEQPPWIGQLDLTLLVGTGRAKGRPRGSTWLQLLRAVDPSR